MTSRDESSRADTLQASIGRLKERLASSYRPPYARMFQARGIRRIPHTLLSVGIGAVWFLLFWLGGLALGIPVGTGLQIQFGLISSTITAELLLTNNAYRRTVEVIHAVADILTTEEQLEWLERRVRFLFASKWQLPFWAAWGSFLLVVAASLGPDYPGGGGFLWLVYCFLTVFLSGSGLWLAIFTLRWIQELPEVGRLRLNLVPGSTLGLSLMSKLAGTFALSFSLVIGLFVFAYFQAEWRNEALFQWVQVFLMFPFLAFCLFFIVYPQTVFRRIIVQRKSETLLDLEHQIAELGLLADERVESGKYERYRMLADLYDRIARARNLPLDFRTVGKFLSSLTIPVLLYLSQNPDLLRTVWGGLAD